jgi:ABC-type nitrate/sulfonate/bicarbonate transport system permease component
MTTTFANNRYFPAALGIGSFVAFIALVELLIRVGMINRFIVPMPSDIIAAFPRVIVEEHVLQRFLLTAGEAFAASILVAIFESPAGWRSTAIICCGSPPRPGWRRSRQRRWC